MGDGIFQPAQDISPGNASAVAVGDFNQDGVDDIARSHSNLNQLSVLQGNGDGTFQAARPLALAGPATVLAVADFDGDNRLDLVAGRFGGLSILTGDGSGRFQTSQEFSFASGGATWQVEVEDLALDGDLDVVSTNIDNSVSVFLNNGGGFNPPLFFCPTG